MKEWKLFKKYDLHFVKKEHNTRNKTNENEMKTDKG